MRSSLAGVELRRVEAREARRFVFCGLTQRRRSPSARCVRLSSFGGEGGQEVRQAVRRTFSSASCFIFPASDRGG